jgi:hypothetical protein
MSGSQYVFAVDYGAATPVVRPISKVEFPLNCNLGIRSTVYEILRVEILPSRIDDNLVILRYESLRVYIGNPTFEGNIEIPPSTSAVFYPRLKGSQEIYFALIFIIIINHILCVSG